MMKSKLFHILLAILVAVTVAVSCAPALHASAVDTNISDGETLVNDSLGNSVGGGKNLDSDSAGDYQPFEPVRTDRVDPSAGDTNEERSSQSVDNNSREDTESSFLGCIIVLLPIFLVACFIMYRSDRN